MLCSKTCDLFNMREAAIKSHALESKNTQIWVWVIVLGSVISLQVAEQLEHWRRRPDAGLSKTTDSSMSQFVTQTDCQKSEVL